MRHFKVSIVRVECPRCHGASLEVMIDGKLYRNGSIKAVKLVKHSLCYFDIARTPTDDDLMAARAQLKKLGWDNPPLTRDKDFVPRDPSQPNHDN